MKPDTDELDAFIYENAFILVSFYHGTTAPVRQGLLIIEHSRSHSDTPHSVGFLWTGDRPVAETFT